MQVEQFALHAEIETRHWWFRGRRQIIRQLVTQLAPPGAGCNIIEVGCGTGANIADLGDSYSCIGIDPSADGIRQSRERFPGVTFVEGMAPEDIPEQMSEADLILLLDVLEHVEDDHGLLSSLASAIKPRAKMLITVPANPSLWSPHDEAFGHLRRYGLPGLKALWQELPVTELMLSYYMARLYPVVKMVRWLTHLRGKSSGNAGTDFSIPPGPINRLLESFFAGESKRLLSLLAGRHSQPYSSGVSLIAALEKS